MNTAVLLPIAYLPDISYLKYLLQTPVVIIEKHEHFVRQTCRNRCDILTSAGKLTLSIPLIKQSEKECISTKRISYAENWQHQHWRTITTAYKSAPFFEFFQHEFKPFYQSQYEFLFEYNFELLKTILNILRIKKDFLFTENYSSTYPQIMDLRNLNFQDYFNIKPYYQVFEDKFGFTTNLSCLDALFNEGLGLKNM